MNRIPVQGTAVIAGVASVALAGVTLYFWKVTSDKVRQLESARQNVMGTLDRLREKGTSVADNLRDVQDSLNDWSSKCDEFQEDAVQRIEQIRRDLHQKLLQEEEDQEDDDEQVSLEGSSQQGENVYEIEEYAENVQHPILGLGSDRVLAEVHSNIAAAAPDNVKMVSSELLGTTKAGTKLPNQAQQQLLKIQNHMNQATAFLNTPPQVLGN